MEVRIGVQSAPRELTVETSTPAGEIEQALADALASDGVFTLAVEKGGKVFVAGRQDRLPGVHRGGGPPDRLRQPLTADALTAGIVCLL